MKTVFPRLAAVLLLFATSANARLSLPEIAPSVHGRLFVPAHQADTPRPAVVLLHGVEGIKPVYLEEAQQMADHGYAVLVLDYYAGVRWGGLHRAERARRWDTWEEEVIAGVQFLRAQPAVDGNRIALVGMSQGAALALTTAPRVPDLAALVDYYGPHPDGWYVARFIGQRRHDTSSALTMLPPVLIVHGSWDPVVPLGNSRRLIEQLRSQKRDVEVQIFPHALHSLNHPKSSIPGAIATAQMARARVIRFLDEHLVASAPTETPAA